MEKEVIDYFQNNKKGVILFYDSIDNYIVSRFLMNNSFLKEGLIFSHWAIEKILKSVILLKKGTLGKLEKSHDTFALKEELGESELDKYNNLFKRISGDFKGRYMENEISRMKASWELKEIDELYLVILEILPIIEELKYKSKFFQYLFSKSAQDNYAEALIEHNVYLKKKVSNFKIEWERFQ